MEKRGKIKISLILTALLISILLIIFVLADVTGINLTNSNASDKNLAVDNVDVESLNIKSLDMDKPVKIGDNAQGFYDENKIVKRTPTTDIYEISSGLFEMHSYSKPVNMKNLNGEYKPYEKITSFSYDGDSLILKWNNKLVKFNLYTKNKEDIKEKFKDKGVDKKNELNFKTHIEKRKGSYYFDHTLDKEKQPKKVGYDIETENVECIAKDYFLICDEQIIDFSDAVNKQNLGIDIKADNIEISGEDLSYIDPSVSLFYADDTGMIGYAKFDSPSTYTEEYSDIIISCFGSCSDWVSRGLAFFEVNSTKGEIVVDSADIILDMEYGNIGLDNQFIYDVDEVGWSSASDSAKFNDLGSGNDYSEDITWGQSTGEHIIELNLQAKSDIENSIAENRYFGVGFKNSDEAEDSSYIKINISREDYMMLNMTFHSSAPPITTATGNFSDNNEEYMVGSMGNRSVDITLECNSCQNTTYCTDTDNSCNPTSLYSNPVTISTDGFSYIKFRSTASDGNQEEIKSENIHLELNQPLPSPIVWPECNPADSCCDINGYLKSNGHVCRSAHDISCDTASTCGGSAVEDRCDGVSPECPDSDDPITYNEACDDIVCSSQSCSDYTFQPERTCSVGICQTNDAYDCPDNLNCLDANECKKKASSDSDCKTDYNYDENQEVCWLDEGNYEYDRIYNKNGNLISIFNNKSGLGLRYYYNDFNQLANVTDELGFIVLAEYFYDHLGNRIKTVEYIGKGNLTTYYFNNFIRVENSVNGDDEFYTQII